MKINKVLILSILILLLTACVSGAPPLTTEQATMMLDFPVHKVGDNPNNSYEVISDISGADCSGAPFGGRIWGDAEKAIEVIKAKAIHEGADALINVSCGAVPLLNNCWAAKKCKGVAVEYK